MVQPQPWLPVSRAASRPETPFQPGAPQQHVFPSCSKLQSTRSDWLVVRKFRVPICESTGMKHPNNFASSTAVNPSRSRWAVSLAALKRIPETFASCASRVGFGRAVFPSCLTVCSRAASRRLRAAISERCCDEDFLIPDVSARASLRATREISDLKTDAMFGKVFTFF